MEVAGGSHQNTGVPRDGCPCSGSWEGDMDAARRALWGQMLAQAGHCCQGSPWEA